MPYYLCIGDDPLEAACRYATKKDALNAFREAAEELAQYGQTITGTVHIADKRSECVDDPDLYLCIGPRGGVQCT